MAADPRTPTARAQPRPLADHGPAPLHSHGHGHGTSGAGAGASATPAPPPPPPPSAVAAAAAAGASASPLHESLATFASALGTPQGQQQAVHVLSALLGAALRLANEGGAAGPAHAAFALGAAATPAENAAQLVAHSAAHHHPYHHHRHECAEHQNHVSDEEAAAAAAHHHYVSGPPHAPALQALHALPSLLAFDATALLPASEAATAVASLEEGLGRSLALIARRARLADAAQAVVAAAHVGAKRLAHQTVEALQAWLMARDAPAEACDAALAFTDQWLHRDGAFDADVAALRDALLRGELARRSLWLVARDGFGQGSDTAGLHHVLQAGEDVNVLVLASDPAGAVAAPAGSESGDTALRARRDVALYALNYGSTYVASCAPSHDPAQFERSLREAAAFRGPAVVVAFVEAVSGDGSAVEAVATGRWPLFRWDPALDAAGLQGFHADSAKLRDDLTAFVERSSHLSLLANAEPQMQAGSALGASLDAAAEQARTAAARRLGASYARLLGALQPPPLHVLFGSDSGNAEALARRLAADARTKGFTDVTLKAMDAVPIEQLHELATAAAAAAATSPDGDAAVGALVVCVVSTAGQGEFPLNARGFWKQLQAVTAAGSLAGLRFAVFGLGDSNYWPRKEQRHFFNKPSVDLDTQLAALGARRLLERGVGDDQDVGGCPAGFRAWLPELWESLGLAPAASAAEVKVRINEDIKVTSHFLRGTIAQGLGDSRTGALTYEDTQLIKFHGIYQQDDRDLRPERKRRGLEPAYSFMVRVRIPGGLCSPAQYLALDAVADTHANGTIRATTRQAVQFHGIIKGLLKPGIAAINRALMDTLAACGDVNRNVMCTANPKHGALHASALALSVHLSAHLSPRTTAYHEIWLDEHLVGGGSVDVEPIYGAKYLPRKFKIGVAVPPDNDVDIYTQDLAFVAFPGGGYGVLVGGGMGMTHGNTKTYPRLAEDLCFVETATQAIAVAEAVVTTQRDHGDRVNRKLARLKYTIDRLGLDWFREEVQRRTGFPLLPPRPYSFTSNADRVGWVSSGASGLARGAHEVWSYTLFIESGRIKDPVVREAAAGAAAAAPASSYRLKSGLRAIAEAALAPGSPLHGLEFRFTPNQNLMLANVSTAQKPALARLLAEYGIENRALSGLRLNSMACVSMPTCALGLAESERYLPSLLTRLEEAIEVAGLREEAITIRMTGCGNGCARPFVSEIGLVGRSPGVYNLYLGAGFSGERLNKLVKEGLDEEAIVAELAPLFKRYATGRRNAAERFGDWCVRAGVVKATLSGLTFHDL